MINSNYIKASLMSYYRFKRGYICVDECLCTGHEISDILVDTGDTIIDIEIKISKSDLITGEARKRKHNYYKQAEGKVRHPNKFYICVPANLKEVTEQWVSETNPLYGIIIYNPPMHFISPVNFEYNLHFIKHAKSINSKYSGEYFREIMAKRLSSSIANRMQKDIVKYEFENRNS